MSEPQTIRDQVAEQYTRAVERAVPAGGCCGGPEFKGTAVRAAGYGAELEGLPDDAVSNAFGCGNPVAHAGLKPGQVVIDLGSGAGIDLLLAARRVGPGGRVIGVDMTDAMIRRATGNARAAGLANVEVRKGLIESLPVDAGSADWVISNCVINLSPEKDRVFAEIRRVLRLGGRFVISDIVVERLPEALRSHPGLYGNCVAGAISEAAYCQGLERAGLEEVVVTDRLVYAEGQLAALLESESAAPGEAGEAGEASGCGCGCGAFGPEEAADLARDLAGRIWSARFTGVRKS